MPKILSAPTAALRTDGDFLILGLRATPFGIPRALNPASN
jgi:hypothetical protein